MEITKKIKNARVRAGLTESQMAERLQVKRSTYQYWETKTPSIDKLNRIAEALKLPKDYFISSDDENDDEKKYPDSEHTGDYLNEPEANYGTSYSIPKALITTQELFERLLKAAEEKEQILKEHNQFLQDIIRSGFVDIRNTLEINFGKSRMTEDAILVYQKAWVEMFARNESKGDPEKKEDLIEQMGTIIRALSGSGENKSSENAGM